MIFPRALLLCVLLSSASWLLADDFWEQPFDRWKRAQVVRMLNASPWAQLETFTAPIVSKDAGLAGEKELYDRFTARFFSARPDRELYVRTARVMNRYDQMA